MTDEEVYKMARSGAVFGLYSCHALKFLDIAPQRAAYYENCLAYLNKTIQERWPDHEAGMPNGQNQ